MGKKLLLLTALLLFLLPGKLLPQTRGPFSGDPSAFREELFSFMGTDLSEERQLILDSFLAAWDSSAFSTENSSRILDLSSQLASRQMRPVPHFIEFLKTINDFSSYSKDRNFLGYWLTGLGEMLFNPRLTNENVARYFQSTSLLIKDNVLFISGSLKWKVKNADLKFGHDTVLYITVKDATLTCYVRNDSTEIYDVTGTYYPDIQQFRGTSGLVTWEKAGFPRGDVFATLGSFTINTTKNSIQIDSARITHKQYFSDPVPGILTDQATGTGGGKSPFPRFETYAKHFRIKNLYDGVDYEGGLTFEGANVKGSGDRTSPAKITLSKNDTTRIKVSSLEFIFSRDGLNSQETSAVLYLDGDSIYHSNLGFSYNSNTRYVGLFRTSNPVSSSPYFNSYHNLDMYFEYLGWDMNGSKIILSRPRGSSLGQAEFESVSFFNSDYFLKLLGLDQYHPLNRLKQFSDFYYSDTFPVSEFAKWLNKPEELVTGLCIDMANQGFVFFDRTNREVTIKKKVNDFLEAYAGKKDYDVLSILSETEAPVDNAVLDLSDFDLTVYGVKNVFLSDSQRVAIYPYNRQLTLGRNREMKFDGVVVAGLFTVFGHNFVFDYENFRINMNSIDSILIAAETGKKDEFGNMLSTDIQNSIQMSSAELLIDKPDNKSGLRSYTYYPIISTTDNSYIFFDRLPGLENIYNRDDFYFKVDSFSYENIDHFTMSDLNLPGELHGGNIIKPTRMNVTIQKDNSLGFNMALPGEGMSLYNDKAVLYDSVSMSKSGLKGNGRLRYLSATLTSDDFSFYPDSMLTAAESFSVTNDGSGLFPDLDSKNVKVRWDTKINEMSASNSPGNNFEMYRNGTVLDGNLLIRPSGVNGAGIINTPDSRITSGRFSFAESSLKADTADYYLKSPSTSGYAFIAENANTNVDFGKKVSSFHLNTDSSMVKFPEVQYICTMTDFTYRMDEKILEMEQKAQTNYKMLSRDELLRTSLTGTEKPTFFSTNRSNDTISFRSVKGRYHVAEEYIEAENINYLHIADALIQPENGRLIINRRAMIKPLENALVAINNRHLLHSAKISIESTKSYSGGGLYDYVSDDRLIQQISFPELVVDTLMTSAKGFIAPEQNFMLNPWFSFTGDVTLSARETYLKFTGASGIIHDCSAVPSRTIRFTASLDPRNIMIPVDDKPRDMDNNLVYSGSFINIDSVHIYPAFLSDQKSWADVAVVSSGGYLWFDKSKNSYLITSRERIANPSASGNILAFNRTGCELSGEGLITLGTDFGLVKLGTAGNYVNSIDSSDVTINTLLGLDFHFSAEALAVMADEIRQSTTLKPVSLNSAFYENGMRDLLGETRAQKIKEEMSLFGTSKNPPSDLPWKLLLNDVTLRWDEANSSFRSEGRIGIGIIAGRPVNLYAEGFIEIQRRRSGDMIDIYLKVNESVWYYFSYFRGVMMAQAGNRTFNNIISRVSQKDRKHPASTVREPYSYMIAVEDRLGRFLRRMTESEQETEPYRFEDLMQP